MKIKEQTRKLAAGCTWVRQGDVDVVWIWFSKSISFISTESPIYLFLKLLSFASFDTLKLWIQTSNPNFSVFASATAFSCPICQENLALVESSLKCSNRHSFDLAKFGYVNLAPQIKQSANYDKEKLPKPPANSWSWFLSGYFRRYLGLTNN